MVSHATCGDTYVTCAAAERATAVTAVLNQVHRDVAATRDKLRAIADARGMSVSKLSRNVLDEFVKRETRE